MIKKFLDLGMQPLANKYLTKTKEAALNIWKKEFKGLEFNEQLMKLNNFKHKKYLPEGIDTIFIKKDTFKISVKSKKKIYIFY